MIRADRLYCSFAAHSFPQPSVTVPAPPTDRPRLRLDIAYEGTGFAGWQIQPDAPTVQGELERALDRVYGRRVRLAGASRTDAGVHALHQVCHFDLLPDDVAIPPAKVRQATQRFLPPTITILRTAREPAAWHSIKSVASKRYRYLIHESAVSHPALRRWAWRVDGPLDAELMQEAAARLVGRHDFACFETTGAPRRSTVRTVFELTLRETAAGLPYEPLTLPGYAPGRLLALEIEGDGFLYNMVRTIAGTLVKVGKRRWTPDDVSRILASRDRNLAGETAPAHGLWLTNVRYGERRA